MDIMAALYSELSESTNGIVAYTSYRIFPGVAAQGAKKPYIVNQIISNVPYHANVKDVKVYRPVVSVSIWSASYSQCRTIAKKVENALQDFRGVMGGAGGITIQRSFWEDEIELPEIDPETMRAEYRIVQDYQIFHTSST